MCPFYDEKAQEIALKLAVFESVDVDSEGSGRRRASRNEKEAPAPRASSPPDLYPRDVHATRLGRVRRRVRSLPFSSSLFEFAFISASTTPRERGCLSTAPFSTNNNTWFGFARFESTV